MFSSSSLVMESKYFDSINVPAKKRLYSDLLRAIVFLTDTSFSGFLTYLSFSSCVSKKTSLNVFCAFPDIPFSNSYTFSFSSSSVFAVSCLRPDFLAESFTYVRKNPSLEGADGKE